MAVEEYDAIPMSQIKSGGRVFVGVRLHAFPHTVFELFESQACYHMSVSPAHFCILLLEHSRKFEC